MAIGHFALNYVSACMDDMDFGAHHVNLNERISRNVA